MADAGIVRNRAKIEATVANARAAALDVDLSELLWSYAPPRGHVRSHLPRCRRRPPESRALGARTNASGFPICRPDHGLCVDAGHRDGRRSPA